MNNETKIENPQAFPLKEALTSDNLGMTLRDYFAARAPTEIPDWFKIESGEAPQQPKIWSDYPESEPFREEMRTWHQDPEFDIAEEISFYQESWEAYRKARYDQENQQVIDRYFAWRFSYADAMLKQRMI